MGESRTYKRHDRGRDVCKTHLEGGKARLSRSEKGGEDVSTIFLSLFFPEGLRTFISQERRR